MSTPCNACSGLDELESGGRWKMISVHQDEGYTRCGRCMGEIAFTMNELWNYSQHKSFIGCRRRLGVIGW